MPPQEVSSAYEIALAQHANGANALDCARELVALMNEDERVAMLDGGAPFWAGLRDLGSGGYHRRPFRAAVVERLGIPGIAFSDGPRGAVIGPATAFPVAIARGATFDLALEYEVATAIGREIKGVGANLFGGICINVLRHLAWGRAQETYGEDPYLLSMMATSAVNGVQQSVMATVKHFACNSIEEARFIVDVSVDPSTLAEVYLPHFHAAVRAGVACVMSAYNSVNAEWCGQSHLLLDEILRQRMGFEGFVISDWIFGVRDAVKSLEAGLDIEMPYRMVRHDPVVAALLKGQLDLRFVDRACDRVIATMLRFGVTAPEVDLTILATPSHRALARRVAAQSFVLLKNEIDGAALLPVTPDISIGLFGTLADVANLGDGGSSDVYAPDVVTIRQGLAERFGELTYLPDGDGAARLAAGVDLAVVVVGCTRANEGEFIGELNVPELTALMPGADDPGLVDDFTAYLQRVDIAPTPGYGSRAMGADAGGDRSTLELSEADRDLVALVTSQNPRTVVVVMGATAALLTNVADQSAAVLCVFYPGLEGGRAVADVLVGAAEPAGRLPFALPRRADDLVDFDSRATAVTYGPLHGQWHLDANGTVAAFPFGFGLGWGAVTLLDATVASRHVTVRVHNPGSRTTNTVIFCHARLTDHQRPWRLVGFARLYVEAGATATGEVVLDPEFLGRFDAATGQLVLPDGEVEIEIGRFARDPRALTLLAHTRDLVG